MTSGVKLAKLQFSIAAVPVRAKYNIPLGIHYLFRRFDDMSQFNSQEDQDQARYFVDSQNSLAVLVDRSPVRMEISNC